MVGSYAYLDGELHVRLSLAMDAIVRGLTESRANVMVSFENRSFFFFLLSCPDSILFSWIRCSKHPPTPRSSCFFCCVQLPAVSAGFGYGAHRYVARTSVAAKVIYF